MSKLATKEKKAANYDERSIVHIEYPESVRRRAPVYLNEKGHPIIFRAVKELTDNSVDERAAGRNDYVETVINHEKNEYIVADSGAGVPVGPHPVKKVPTIELVFASLHAGGKFDNKAYKTAAGVNGLGAACTNAVSESFQVWTKRNDQWYYIAWEKGVKVKELTKVKTPAKEVMARLQKKSKEYGTIILFRPDQSVLSIDSKYPNALPKSYEKAVLDVKQYVAWTRMIALLNVGLEMVTTFEDKNKIFRFHNTKGLAAAVDHILKQNDLEGKGKPLVFQNDTIDLAIQWSNYEECDHFKTYANCGQTRDHGRHYDGFKNALGRAIQKYKGKTDKFSTADCLYGMVGVLNYRMSEAEFSSQTKDKLTSNVSKIIEDQLIPVFDEFFDKNKTLVKTIIKQAQAIGKGRESLAKAMKAIAGAKKGGRSASTPDCLISSETKNAEERELYCFTGDTEVLLADGTKKSFIDLVSDYESGKQNQCISFDFDARDFKVCDIGAPRVTRIVDTILEVSLSSGDVVRCTHDHQWLTISGKWTPADRLTAGDEITTFGQGICVISTKTIVLNSSIPVYDLTVDKHHNFALANGCIVHNCVEGDSAASSAKLARDPKYQEIFKLTGKPANASELPLPKVLEMKALQNLIVALGINPNSMDLSKEDMSKMTFSTKGLRVGSLYTLADADVDGKHITCLILALIWRVVPDLIKEGKVFIVDAPLYNAFHNNKRYFGATFDDVAKQLPKGAPTHIISRAKGWGEISADMLRYVAFDPKTRRVLRVTPPPAGSDAEEYFRNLMSSAATHRELLGL